MTTESTPEVLDSALQRLQAGEPLSDILADHESDAGSLEALLQTAQALSAAHHVVLPSREQQRADRNGFLAEIRDLQQLPVSPGFLTRLRVWIVRSHPAKPAQQTLMRKERRPMAVLLLKLALVLGLGFGSAGGTVALAEHSLPGSPLYPVKLAAEEMMVKAISDPSDQASLYLAQAQVRAREMVQTVQNGDVPDDAALTRLRARIERAFSVATQLNDPELNQWLVQAHQALRTQEQELFQAREQIGEQARAQLQEAMMLTQQARQMVEAGLQDPQTFRQRHSLGTDGDQAGRQEQRGPQPTAPGPGEPGGNPDGTCTDCTPAGDENQYGPQPSQPGPGEPGGNPDGTCTDCTPEGDQHQYGSQPDQPAGTPTSCPNCEYNRDTWMYRYGPQAGQYQHHLQLTPTPTSPVAGATPTPEPQPPAPGQSDQHHGDPGGSDQGGGSGDGGGGDSGGSDQGGGSGDGGGGDSGGSDQGGSSGDSGGGDSGGSDQGGGSGDGGGSSNSGGGGRSK